MGTPGEEYVATICRIYGDVYDDREEDSRIRGLDWVPGVKAGHKSIAAFQKELEEVHGIRLSRTKIQKILVTGGCWTTERSREIQVLYTELTRSQSGIDPEQAVSLISQKLDVSKPTVVVNLPYINGVNGLEQKSKNALRCAKYRKRKQESTEQAANKAKITKF